jgi:predicted nuclease with TOPRIM domain
MPEYLGELLKYGFFAFLGVVATLIAGRRKSGSEVKKLDEEAERLNIENQNLRAEQMNNVIKENSELLKAKDDLRTKLHIATEQIADLSKQLREQTILSAEYQRKMDEMLVNQKSIQETLNSQQQDISNIAKQTGPLPSRDEMGKR